MEQPKIERLLKLMRILSSNVSLSVDDIADRLGTSERTVYRYIDTFREAGFVVQKIKGEVYRLGMMKGGYKDLSKVVYFSEEEAYMVNTLIDSLDNTNALKQTLKKKLAVVYDSAHINSYSGNPQVSLTIQGISEAIKKKRKVKVHQYRSSHSGATKEYLLEPFYIEGGFQDFWAYDMDGGMNKRFKTARVGSVEVLSEGWTCEPSHRRAPMDSFRIHGLEAYHVKLELDLMAKNLMLEEYPLTGRELSREGDRWVYEGDVCGMEGIGRFVMGLSHHIRIIEGQALKDYVRERAEEILSGSMSSGK